MRQSAPRFIPLREVAELYREPSCLNRIKPPIVTFDLVIILFRLAVVTDHLHPSRKAFVIGRNRTALATGTKVFPGIETESGRQAEGPSFFPAAALLREVLSAVGLAGVFDNDQIILLGKTQNWVHVCCLSVQMDRHDRRNNPLRSFLNQLSAPTVKLAFALKVFAQFLWVHRVCVFMDVHESDP